MSETWWRRRPPEHSEDESHLPLATGPLLTAGGADQHWRRQRSSASASTPATPRRHAGGAVAARSTNTACARSFGGCSPHRSPLASRWGRARAVERPLCRYVGGPKGADAPPRAACSRVLVGGRSGVDRHVRPSRFYSLRRLLALGVLLSHRSSRTSTSVSSHSTSLYVRTSRAHVSPAALPVDHRQLGSLLSHPTPSSQRPGGEHAMCLPSISECSDTAHGSGPCCT